MIRLTFVDNYILIYQKNLKVSMKNVLRHPEPPSTWNIIVDINTSFLNNDMHFLKNVNPINSIQNQ